MAEIRQLPPSVINKIAAGEVIERPASVVKELLENAVDALSTRVDVSVVKGGIELMRVADNGHGMPSEQLPLALASHATSKIRDADDLFRVGTLGFRGEALASIAAVSRLRLRSRPHDAPAGAELEVIGGKRGEIVPCGCGPGTVVEIRNLFYNTPVRQKFLRTTQTEMSHISEAVTRIALANPKIHFTLRHNERAVSELPPVAGWRERIAALFGDELADALIEVESTDEAMNLSGYVARPEYSRSNNRMQYLLLNGRHIRDRSLQHALGEAYRGLLLTGRFPIAFLRLTVPPEMVDVNVHPTKLEVRFQESGRIYSQLLGTLRTRFLSTDLTTRLAPAVEMVDSTESAAAHDSLRARSVQSEFVSWAKGETEKTAAPDGPEHGLPEFRRFGADRHGLALTPLDRAWPGAAGYSAAQPAAAEPENRQDDASRSVPWGVARSGVPAVQIHNRYLVTENEEGVVVIDQHALHERVLYEQLKEKVSTGALETQQLLVPEPVHLTAEEAAAALEAQDVLASLGIRVEPFGGDTVLVSSYPAMLANIGPGEVLRQVVERLLAGGGDPDRGDVLDDLLHSIACKAAIKAGDRLSGDEITALLTQRHLVHDAHHCPHGRPAALVFTREELDRRFKRV